MKITKIEMYPQEELIRRLREVTLTDGVTKPYSESEIIIQNYFYFGWENLKFAQRYVLKSDYKKIEEIYEAIRDFGLHPLSLNTFYEITLDTGVTFPFIPPIIEWTPEDGYYVADGMHRMDYCCRNFNYRDYGGNPNVIIIKNPSAPYYALPCELNWDTLPMVDERPEVRKTYRDPNNYKALFRDYNSQFPGIQRDRSKDK